MRKTSCQAARVCADFYLNNFRFLRLQSTPTKLLDCISNRPLMNLQASPNVLRVGNTNFHTHLWSIGSKLYYTQATYGVGRFLKHFSKTIQTETPAQIFTSVGPILRCETDFTKFLWRTLVTVKFLFSTFPFFQSPYKRDISECLFR